MLIGLNGPHWAHLGPLPTPGTLFKLSTGTRSACLSYEVGVFVYGSLCLVVVPVALDCDTSTAFLTLVLFCCYEAAR